MENLSGQQHAGLQPWLRITDAGRVIEGRSMPGETTGRRLAAIRNDRGLRQTELGRLIGRSRQAIWGWENNRAGIGLDDAEACAHALYCRLADLLAPLDAAIPPYPANWWRVLRRMRQHPAPPYWQK
jgi:DNA-binding XRE family transcriptional regulator